MDISHPINDPALISYHRPELQAILPGLDLALDCWNLLSTKGLGSQKEKYLPKEPAEPSAQYKLRVVRSTYTPIYRDSIRAYAGLLSRFQLAYPPPSLQASENDVDRQGSSVYSFWNRSDELALRDGGVYVMVDMPPSEGAGNYLDERNDGRSPYSTQIERRDLINWGVSYDGGRETLEFAVVRRLEPVRQPDSFGTVIEPVYLYFTPGKVQKYTVRKVDGRWTQFPGEVYPYQIPGAGDRSPIPIRWYGASCSRFGQGDLPMNGLAELTIQHFQMRSDLIELLHKCSMPVPVRKGAPVDASGKPRPLVIGPNSGIDVPENGDFFFREPTGTSLERHQAEIAHVEELMDRSSLNFLYGASIKTATEASLRASQISSQVSNLIRNKASAFVGVMKLWAAFAGELSSLKPESGIAINDSLINRPLDPSGIAQVINLYQSKILSRETVLQELQRGGVLDPDLKIAEEVKRVEEERPEKDDSGEDRKSFVTEDPKGQPNVKRGKLESQPGPDGNRQNRIQSGAR